MTTVELESAAATSSPCHHPRKKFKVSHETAMFSRVLADCIEVAADAAVIPVPEVDEDTLAFVVEFLSILKPSSSSSSGSGEEEEDTKRFFDRVWKDAGMATVYDVINAGQYLNIDRLTAAGFRWIAHLMTGMTTEQMRDAFGFVDAFTPEEKRRVLEENAWAYL